MKVYNIGLTQADLIEQPISACIGYFDGLHLGHQKLIEQVIALSEETGSEPALITFDPDPWTIIKQIPSIPHITPMNKRMKIGEQLGIKHWIILSFTRGMAALSIQDFHERVLGNINLRHLVCGYDFHYADKGSGSVSTLQQQNRFQVSIIEEVSSEHQKISSTRIEELLLEGQMEKAARMMGRPYEIEGIVKEGNRIGRTVGFPTANLLMNEHYVIPRQGVYVGEVFVQGRWHPAMMNVGHNPSFNYQKDTSMEAHLFDFTDDIYAQPVIFRFLSFIRGECQFPDKAAFISQLQQDQETAKAYFYTKKE